MTGALWITTVLSLCLEKFLVGLLGMNILIRNLECHKHLLFLGTEVEFFVTLGVLKDKFLKTFLIFRISMCPIPSCQVLMDYGVK